MKMSRKGVPDQEDRDYEMHVLVISKSRLKSSIGTSTLMAGFALVCYECLSLVEQG